MEDRTHPQQVAGSLAGVNPTQVGAFALAIGWRAKTDRLDAALLMHFGEALRLSLQGLKPNDVLRLHALLTRWNQLIGERVR